MKIYQDCNVSFTGLELPSDRPLGIQPRFYTSVYQLNMKISSKNVFKSIEFNVNWQRQNNFQWDTSSEVDSIPSFHTIDAQLSLKQDKFKFILESGGSTI